VGEALNVGFIVLVDDAVRSSEWEQELYRMGVPPEIEVVFASTEEASRRLPEWEGDTRVGILVAGNIDTLAALTVNSHRVGRVNVGACTPSRPLGAAALRVSERRGGGAAQDAGRARRPGDGPKTSRPPRRCRSRLHVSLELQLLLLVWERSWGSTS